MHLNSLGIDHLANYNALAVEYGTPFDGTAWIRLFGDQLQTLGFFDNGDNLIGGVSLYSTTHYGLRICMPAPFTPSSGPFFKTETQNPVARINFQREIQKTLIDYLLRQRYALIHLCLPSPLQEALPFYWAGFKVIPQYSYIIDLHQDESTLFGNMSSDRRKSIRKAENDGLITISETNLHIVNQMVLKTFTRQDKHLNSKALNSILFSYSNSSNSFAFTTYLKDTPLATCFIVHDNRKAYYLMGGYDTNNRHHGAGPLALFHAIKHAKEIGLDLFDFEGSMHQDIERYFRGFGGTVISYLTVNKAWFPLECILKYSKRNMF